MSGKRTVVKVRIGGDEYSLRSDRPEDYTRAVAEHVDAALRDINRSGSLVEPQKAAILAALAVADELFQAREITADLTRRLDALSADLARLLPPAKRASKASGVFASQDDDA